MHLERGKLSATRTCSLSLVRIIPCLLLAVLGALPVSHSSNAQSAPSEATTDLPLESNIEIFFDIPAQPLASALRAYAAATRLQIFYESGLVVNDRSAPLHGDYTAEQALNRLLEGSRLSAKSFDPGTVTILAPSPRARHVDLATPKARTAEFLPYLALVQNGLQSALCNDSATRTDTAEVRVRLWIAPSGAVAQTDLLSPPETSERGQAYAKVLRAMVLSAPPPPAMPQPVTLLILPRHSQTAADCLPRSASAPAWTTGP